MLLSSLGTSIANVGLPTLVSAFGASFQAVQWVVLAYLLAVTTLVVSVGRLGDLIGRRRLMLVGISLFTASSIACGAATELWLLIAARAGQGLGAAVMMALSMALVGDAVPQERAGQTMGLLGTMSAVGTALGPSLGGLLIAAVGWRAVFLINLPLGLIALGLAYRALPADAPHDRRTSFDLVGSGLLAGTLVAYALSMTLGKATFGPKSIALLVIAFLAAALFVSMQSRVRSPLVRMSLFSDRAISAGFAMSALVTTVAMTTLVVGPFYLSKALGLTTATVGLVMTAGPFVAALAGVPAGRAVDRFGSRIVMLAGLSAMSIGCLALALCPLEFGIAGYILPLVFTTAGFATFQAANNTAVVSTTPANQRGVVSGLLTLSRNLGLITGASVMGAVFVRGTHATSVAEASPFAVASGAHVAFGTAAALVVSALVLAVQFAKPASRT
ncbi:MFS transporter [Lysobacter sp. Root494]|nr:MFS transporter [Lysobacter sp. Root494]